MSKAWAENMVDEFAARVPCMSSNVFLISRRTQTRTRFVNTTLSDVEVFALTCVGVIVVTLLVVKFWVL